MQSKCFLTLVGMEAGAGLVARKLMAKIMTVEYNFQGKGLRTHGLLEESISDVHKMCTA